MMDGKHKGEPEPRRVRVFFYGTFMSPEVLARYGINVENVTAVRVRNFEIYIRPRVNLISKNGVSVYGSVVSVTHEELDRIYQSLEKQFGLKYLPEAVLAEPIETTSEREPVLCFITDQMEPGVPDPEYVRELATCVRALNLPESYALHIESFS
jgi:gamma-glutamyl AIG2-like cyclotransferase